MVGYLNLHRSLRYPEVSAWSSYCAVFPILFAVLTFFPANVEAQLEKIGVGGRAIGMGSAFVAIADDASAVFWNPAGIATSVNDSAQINRQFTLMYSPLYGLSYLQHKFVAYMQDRLLLKSYFGSLGFGIVELDLSPNTEDVQTLSYTENTFLLSWAYSFSIRPILRRFSIGTSFKYYNIHTLKSAFGYGVDLGLLGLQSFEFNKWRLDIRLGMIVQDFGKSSLWYSGSFSPARKEFVEPNYRIGIAIGVARQSSVLYGLLFSTELHKKDKYALENTEINFGAELSLVPNLNLHFGVQDVENPRYAFGFGLVSPKAILSGASLAIDAALLTHPELNNTLSFSLSVFSGGKR